MKLTIGLMGSSGGDLGKLTQRKAYQLGKAIAEHDAILITGGCPGLPYDAARGAKAKNGLVVGISPGLSIDEHVEKYGSPVEGLIFSSTLAVASWEGKLLTFGRATL